MEQSYASASGTDDPGHLWANTPTTNSFPPSGDVPMYQAPSEEAGWYSTDAFPTGHEVCLLLSVINLNNGLMLTTTPSTTARDSLNVSIVPIYLSTAPHTPGTAPLLPVYLNAASALAISGNLHKLSVPLRSQLAASRHLKLWCRCTPRTFVGTGRL